MKVREFMLGDIVFYKPWNCPVVIWDMEETINLPKCGSVMIARVGENSLDDLHLAYLYNEESEAAFVPIPIDLQFIRNNKDKFNSVGWGAEEVVLGLATGNGVVKVIFNKLKVETKFVFFEGAKNVALIVEYVHELQNILRLFGVDITFTA